MSCKLAHEMVACFYNFCAMEKYAKKLTAYMDIISNVAASLLKQVLHHKSYVSVPWYRGESFINCDVSTNMDPFTLYRYQICKYTVAVLKLQKLLMF